MRETTSKSYLILSATTDRGLEDQVNACVDEGFEPIGAVFIHGSRFHQAVYRRSAMSAVCLPVTGSVQFV